MVGSHVPIQHGGDFREPDATDADCVADAWGLRVVAALARPYGEGPSGPLTARAKGAETNE